jgi:hypothetical protein
LNLKDEWSMPAGEDHDEEQVQNDVKDAEPCMKAWQYSAYLLGLPDLV